MLGKKIYAAIGFSTLLISGAACAVVMPQEAARLGRDLTPWVLSWLVMPMVVSPPGIRRVRRSRLILYRAQTITPTPTPAKSPCS